jgi:maleate isomerase
MSLCAAFPLDAPHGMFPAFSSNWRVTPTMVTMPPSVDEVTGPATGAAGRVAIRLGVLVPSSNTVLEPMMAAMLASVPEVTLHASRFRVTQIALDAASNAQFDDAPILHAAGLLADAGVDVIVWCGTSASWLGFDRDQHLCARIRAASGIPACTSVLGLNALLTRQGARRLGLVTPYIGAVQDRIVANYAAFGVTCVAERHLNLRENIAFAATPADVLAGLIQDVARAAPDAIAVVCTNLAGAALVSDLERRLGIPIYDSVATGVWQALTSLAVDPARLANWGRLFQAGIAR